MFIKSIFLENFKNIYTGLHTRKLFIDFTEQKNPICIIVGRNGKGKTSLLSYLSPFATLGSFDIRDTNKLIMENEKGYKRIIFIDEKNNEFDIEHFYTPLKDSVTIKSYFKMNGNELNENGNVTSFKKLVSEFLNIEMDYLKLVRIGDNVQNLIRSRATERKVFMGKILDEVDFYLMRYKQMSQRERDLKTLISHLTDNIKKLGIEDEAIASEEIIKLENQMRDISTSIELLEKKKDETLFKLSEVGYPDNGDERILELSGTLSHYKKLLEGTDLTVVSAATLRDELSELKTRRSDTQGTNKGLIQAHDSLLDSLDYDMENLQNLKLQISKEEDALNIGSLEDYEKELKNNLNTSYETKFDEVQPMCTKEEFEDFVKFLKNTQKILNMTYEFGKEPIREVLDGMRKDKDIPNIITSSLLFIEQQKQSERMSIIDRLIRKYCGVQVACDRACPYKNLHEELMQIRDATPVSSVKHDSEFYQMMKLAHDNLKQVFDDISSYKNLIERLPINIQKMFSIEAIFSSISKAGNIFDETVMHDYLGFLTNLSAYRKMEKELEDVQLEIKKAKAISKVDFFKEQIESTQKKIESLQEKINGLKEDMHRLDAEIITLDKKICETEDLLNAVEQYEGLSAEYEDLQEKKKIYDKITSDVQYIDFNIKGQRTLQRELVQTKYSKEQNLILYKQMWEDIVEKSKECEDYGYLKYAYSNKNGIPLYYIESFLDGVRGIANEILDIIYDGNLRLEKFHIDADNFDIPYRKGDVVVEDISLSSQGEQSYINMALSSALHCKRMTRYNISSFDEVDSTFDDDKRQKFIPVMEKIIEINNTSQAFLITHNLMYSQYPVDIIDLNNPEMSTVSVILD